MTNAECKAIIAEMEKVLEGVADVRSGLNALKKTYPIINKIFPNSMSKMVSGLDMVESHASGMEAWALYERQGMEEGGEK